MTKSTFFKSTGIVAAFGLTVSSLMYYLRKRAEMIEWHY